MGARIKVGEFIANIEEYVWSSNTEGLEDILNGFLDELGPSGADPNPDLHVAMEVVEVLGGEVIDYDVPEYVPDRIY